MISLLPQGDSSLIKSSHSISDLKNAIKELVENSIDANSSSIGTLPRRSADIHLDNFGLSLVEVSDDGEGIEDLNSVFKSQFCLYTFISWREQVFKVAKRRHIWV